MTARPAIDGRGAPASGRRPPPPGAGSPRSRCRRGRSRGRLPARDRPGHGLPLGVGPRGRHEHRGPRPRAVRGAAARPDARDAPDDVRRRGRGSADPPGGGLARGRPHGATPQPPARRASRRRGCGRLDARCGGRDARRPRATRRGDARGAREDVPALQARVRVNIGKRYEGEIGLASRVLLLLAVEGPDRAREAPGTLDQQPVPLDPARALARRAAGGAARRRRAGRARPSLARAVRARHRGGPALVDGIDGARRSVRRSRESEPSRSTSTAGPASCCPMTSRRHRSRSRGSRWCLRSTRPRWGGRSATGTSVRIVRTCSTRTATPARRSGPTGSSSAAGRSATAARSSRSSSRTSGARSCGAVEAEVARLTAWLRSTRVYPRFPTPLDRELAKAVRST